MRVGEISAFLAERAEDVCRILLPGGKRDGSEWRAGDVTGDSGKSLGVHLEGEKAGIWADFATGDSGDLVDLWCAVHGVDLNEALDQIRSHYNLPAPKFEGQRERQAKPINPPKVGSPKQSAKDFLTARGISEAAIKAYRIGENGDEIAFPYFHGDQVVGVKYRHVTDKAKQRWEKGSSAVLFGWQAIPDRSRTVVITEGEVDALTMWDYGYPALSVPAGAGSTSWIEYEYDNLDRFETIYLFLDSDEAGRKKISDFVERLGRSRVRVVDLGESGPKDANELLQEGLAKSVVDNILAKAKTLDPDELKSAASYEAEVLREYFPPPNAPTGIRPPWQVGDVRFRPGEIVLVNGVNGHGKSKLVQQFMLEAGSQDYRSCIASLEMPPRKYLRHMTDQAAGIGSGSDPSKPFIQTIVRWFGEWLWLFDLVGTAKTKRLLEVMEYAYARYGVAVFVVDSLAKCGLDEDDYNGQKWFVERLADFKNTYNVTVFLVTHSRKGESEDRPTGKMDVKGTGAITDLVDTGMTVWRNKNKEKELGQYPEDADIQAKPDAMLYIWKQRYGDWEGSRPLWFHPGSYQFLGNQQDAPRAYVNFSMMETGVA